MGAHSTIKVTRTTARRLVADWMATGVGDDELRFLCDHILDERLYNVQLVSDDEENDDDRI